MNRIKLSENISYIKSSEDPLSADIGIVKDGDDLWLFDVGNGDKSIDGLEDDYHIVLSHFHADHIGNIGRVRSKSLYVSRQTFKYTHMGTIVKTDCHIGDIHIFPLPSSHSKGCLGMEVGREYAFVGDALYGKEKDGFQVYNAQLLKEEINVLSDLEARYLLVSHFDGLIRKKEEVLDELRVIYEMREKNIPEIKIRMEVGFS